MTDIEQKALALVNKACKSDFRDLGITYRNNILDALLLAIEQHEAFRQEVSAAVEDAKRVYGGHREAFDKLERFIIAKPDPLVEAVDEGHKLWMETLAPLADSIRAAIEKRGGKIVWGEG